MKKLIALALLAVAGCNPLNNVSKDDQRWTSLKGSEVYVVKSHSVLIHANKACPDLQNPKGDVIKCKIDGDRVVDANGIFLNSEREKPPLCPQCVP